MLLTATDVRLESADGTRALLKGASLVLKRGERLALVGPNGAGKSTLLNALFKGDAEVDGGDVRVRRGTSVGALAQAFGSSREEAGLPVLEAVFTGDAPTSRAVRTYAEAMASGDEHAVAEAVGLVEAAGAWEAELDAKTLLSKLGCDGFLDRVLGELSGGQRKRVGLAAALLAEPDVLFLDEPTNHLSVEGVEWLEERLASDDDRALLFVSHDRAFIDNVCTAVLELDGRGNLYRHAGSYDDYLKGQAERLHAEARDSEKARALVRKESEWMGRQPKARTTKSASRVAAFYDLKERAKGQERFSTEMSLDGTVTSQRLGNRVVELKEATLKLGDTVIMDKLDYTFIKGQRLGIVGKNGAGKTSFMRAVLGEIPLDDGDLDVGETVRVAHFTQEPKWEDESVSAAEWIKETAADTDVSLPKLLERFAFTGSRQYTPIGELSGGEQRRLQLLGVLAKAPNFLVLDEPTNDLDLTTIETFEQVLQEFDGVVIVVSHDRAFMDGLVESMLVFEGDGRIFEFTGTYAELREWQRQQAEAEERVAREEAEKERAQQQPREGAAAPAAKDLDAATRKAILNAPRDAQKLEAKIAEAEEKLEAADAELMAAGADVEAVEKLAARRSKVEAELEKLYAKYEEVDTLLALANS